MDEKAYYSEAPATKPVTLNCPWCRTQDTYDVKYLVRTKKDRLPGGADERDHAAPKVAGGRPGIDNARHAVGHQQYRPVLPDVMKSDDAQIVQEQQAAYRDHDGAEEQAVCA